jgi:hypothetical protein
VFDLVLWSFVIAITPLTLGLAWKLIFQVGNWIVLGLSRPSVNNEPRGLAHTVNRQMTSSYISGSGWTPCM